MVPTLHLVVLRSVACVCVDTFFDRRRLLSVVLESLTVAVGMDLGLFGDRGQPLVLTFGNSSWLMDVQAERAGVC